MRSPIKLLSSLQTHSSDKSYTYDRLYRNLYNPGLFMLAYQNIYASPGNMTKGIDGNTIDAMSLNRIEGMRTMAIQLPEELFERLKAYLKKNNLKQKQFIIRLIEDALEQDEEDTAEQPETEESDEPDMEAEEE